MMEWTRLPSTEYMTGEREYVDEEYDAYRRADENEEFYRTEQNNQNSIKNNIEGAVINMNKTELRSLLAKRYSVTLTPEKFKSLNVAQLEALVEAKELEAKGIVNVPAIKVIPVEKLDSSIIAKNDIKYYQHSITMSIFEYSRKVIIGGRNIVVFINENGHDHHITVADAKRYMKPVTEAFVIEFRANVKLKKDEALVRRQGYKDKSNKSVSSSK